MDTSHIEPTLTDTEVLEFCKRGYLLLDGVVPEEINRKTVSTSSTRTRPSSRPTSWTRSWFVENVILNPAAAGADTLAAGIGIRDPNTDEQPPRAYAGAGARLASRRRVALWTRAALPASLLLPRGMHRRHGADGSAPRFALPVSAFQHDGALRKPATRRQDRRVRRLDLPDRLFHLAPPFRVDGAGDSQPPQVQLLAHVAADPRLGD